MAVQEIEKYFKDEEGTNLNQYQMIDTEDNSIKNIKLVRKPTLTQVGTPLNASNFNGLIDSINNNFSSLQEQVNTIDPNASNIDEIKNQIINMQYSLFQLNSNALVKKLVSSPNQVIEKNVDTTLDGLPLEEKTELHITLREYGVSGKTYNLIIEGRAVQNKAINFDITLNESSYTLTFTLTGNKIKWNSTSNFEISVDDIYVIKKNSNISTLPIKGQALNDYTWEEIAIISENGFAMEYFNVGDEKKVSISGSGTYTFVILGFNHDEKVGGGYAGITFGMKELIPSVKMNTTATNVGGWGSSYIRNTIIPTTLQQMPQELLNVTKQVYKKTSSGNLSNTIVSTKDILFVMSEVEVYGRSSLSFSGEGKQYNYYKTIATTNATKKKYPLNSTISTPYWLRSPSSANNTNFVRIIEGSSLSINADSTQGFSFCFCV